MSNKTHQKQKWEEQFDKQFWYVPKNDEEATACTAFHATHIKSFIQSMRNDIFEAVEGLKDKKIKWSTAESLNESYTKAYQEALDDVLNKLREEV